MKEARVILRIGEQQHDRELTEFTLTNLSINSNREKDKIIISRKGAMTLSIALFVLILGIIFISLLTFCLQIVYKIISLQKGKGRKCKRSASLSLNRYLVLLLNSLFLVCDLSLFHHYIKNKFKYNKYNCGFERSSHYYHYYHYYQKDPNQLKGRRK